MSDGLNKALRIIIEFQKLSPSLSIACAHTFLFAAKFEGRTMGHIGQQSSVSNSSVSRHVQDLSEARAFRQHGGRVVPVPGHGLLLTRGRPEDRREKEVFLTARGRALVAVIEEIAARS